MSRDPDGARPAVFMDRDGTLILERRYLSDPEGVHLVPGAAEALKALRGAGFALVVATNQSGIARGIYTEGDYRSVEERIDRELEALGARLDATYFCPHHPAFTGPCDCRKPGTGMYERAAREHGLALERSWYVGDRRKDVLPAQSLGGRGILVRTGYGREEEENLPAGFGVVDDLPAAARRILEKTAEGRRGGASSS